MLQAARNRMWYYAHKRDRIFKYIASRYGGNPCVALAHHKRTGWY